MLGYVQIREFTDLELIEFSKQGDESAFAEIVRRHRSRIASTIFGMLGKCDEADDIGQEVFIRFFRSLSNFRGESALSTYLTRIAINLSLNELKRRKKRFLSFDKIIEDGGDIEDKDNKTNYSETDEIVRNAIQKLNPKYRSVVVLRLIDGYSSQETADILEIPLGTVLSRLQRAQLKLKDYLTHYKLES